TLAACGGRPTLACTLRHQFGRGGDAVARVGRPRWSFTVHGPEEFDRAAHIGLAEKVRQCTFVIVISSYGRSQLYRFAEHAHWPRVDVVHWGLERSFYGVAADLAPAVRRFVCVGRLCKQKGQLLLVEAARRLATQGIEFELILAGDGELRTEIELLVARYA